MMSLEEVDFKLTFAVFKVLWLSHPAVWARLVSAIHIQTLSTEVVVLPWLLSCVQANQVLK